MEERQKQIKDNLARQKADIKQLVDSIPAPKKVGYEALKIWGIVVSPEGLGDGGHFAGPDLATIARGILHKFLNEEFALAGMNERLDIQTGVTVPSHVFSNLVHARTTFSV